MKKADRILLFGGALLSTAIFSMPAAKAYIDPSVTTYTIQAIVGAAVAIGAVAAIWWRKAKKKVTKTLGIDENQKKTMEDEIEEIDVEDESGANK